MDELTPGWRFVHIGFEGDGVELRGVRLWGLDWGRSIAKITVRHPQYPDERHPMWVYRVEAAGQKLEFAAGEFSNGVWGFFEPVASNSL